MARDYYEVLGVSRDASAEELQQAYRRLARRLHPDVNKSPGAEDQFKEVNEAYHTLADPQSRAQYDRFGAGYRERAAAGRPGPGPRRPRGPWPGGPGRDGPGAGPEEWIFQGQTIDLEDLISGVFGGRGPAGPVAGADQEAELALSVEEAYRGGPRRISVDGRSFEVTIPAGVIEGQRIRLAGQGGQGRGGAPRGDLYLAVRIAPHPRYRLSGRDIEVTLPLAAWEAALGANLPVETPGGEAKVQVPPGSSSGRRLRLRGQGLPNPRGAAGDLYARVMVMVPPDPQAPERELFEELRRVSTFDPRRGSR
jgi:curved DNA-binding protein